MAEFDAQSGRRLPADPTAASAQSTTDRRDLHHGLAALSETVSGSVGMAASLAEVAQFAARAIPGAEGAGVTLVRPGTVPPALYTGTASDDFVTEIDRIQYEVVGEGPCLTSMDTRRPAVSGSLGSDARWPRFGGRVARLGVHSALSFPLMVGDEIVGAINSYARGRDAFTEHAVRLGEQFAGPAAVAVHNARVLAAARTAAEQLQVALASRSVIDQAIGILRSRSGSTADEALARLRATSQSRNVKVSVLAERLVDEAVRRAHARHSQS